MNRVVIGLGSCGIAAGGRAVVEACGPALDTLGITARVETTGCLGMCYREVVVWLSADGGQERLCGEVTPERLPGLLSDAFLGTDLLPEHVVRTATLASFLDAQERVVLRNCGRVDPDSLVDYCAQDGYAALHHVLRERSPDEIVAEISQSGLRGRGGAGFPTGRKWALARAAGSDTRYVICNADEGDPGAFMDRNILESDPYSVIEGMTIAAYAIGASVGWIYVRGEYPLVVARLLAAISRARGAGLLGEAIAGSSFRFELGIKRGAGAFVCGEETALIASVEGRRGTPRLRPPYPVERGLYGQPTVINNVETYANVPWICTHGAQAFARLGTTRSRGTKVFSLAGDVRRSGMVEVPMGTPIRQIIEEIGGGSGTGRPLKAVQIGGPSGGCLPATLFDTPVDYESLTQTGAIMGSGGLIALDTACCMVDVARYFLRFTQEESCGKCTFCRLGTKRMLEILDRLCAGEGRDGDLERLEALARQVQAASLCGLGRSAPNPVLGTLRYFRDEYEAHLKHRRCPAGRCRSLISFSIDRYLCDGCGECQKQCAVDAIARDPRIIPLSIDSVRCTRCGGCVDACQFRAVRVR